MPGWTDARFRPRVMLISARTRLPRPNHVCRNSQMMRQPLFLGWLLSWCGLLPEWMKYIAIWHHKIQSVNVLKINSCRTLASVWISKDFTGTAPTYRPILSRITSQNKKNKNKTINYSRFLWRFDKIWTLHNHVKTLANTWHCADNSWVHLNSKFSCCFDI